MKKSPSRNAETETATAVKKAEEPTPEPKTTQAPVVTSEEMSPEAEAASKDVVSRMLAVLKPFADKRDESEAKMKRLENALVEFVAKRDAIQTEIALIVKESTAAMMDGKETTKATKQIGTLKAELAEVQTWLEEITSIALPKARIAHSASQNELDAHVTAAAEPLIAEYKKRIVDAVRIGVELADGYLTGLYELRKITRVNLVEYTPGKSDGGAEAIRARREVLQQYLNEERGIA